MTKIIIVYNKKMKDKCICQKSKQISSEQCPHNRRPNSLFCGVHRKGTCAKFIQDTVTSHLPQTCIPTSRAKPVDFIKATSASPTDIWVFKDDINTYFGKYI